jgi:hypothetical protein
VFGLDVCCNTFNLSTHVAVTIFKVTAREKEEWIEHKLKHWNCVCVVHSGTFFSRKRGIFTVTDTLQLNAVSSNAI